MLTALAGVAFAQTADEIIAKYIKTIGGAENIAAIKTIRMSGKFTGGGGFEAAVLQENKRPNLVREEFSLQGLTGITAYDSATGWKIQPWEGKKDPELLGEDEMKNVTEAADFDGPLVDYAAKGNRIEYLGTEPVEGTDAFKLKVSLANGDIQYFYMDTDYYVPIKIETRRVVRGAEREFETILGDYKEVNGVYFPYSFESGSKGSADKSKIVYDTIEVNVPVDDSRFHMPTAQRKTSEKK